jgi:type II secretory pathway pseudopilin PulG
MNPEIYHRNRGLHRNGVSGFTVVELLVVVLVLLVFMVLLVPGLCRARNRSQATVCRGNLEALMTGVNLYAADHERYFPAPGWDEGYASWAASASFPFGHIPFTNSFEPQLESLRHGQIYPYIVNPAFYRCPSDQVDLNFRQRAVYVTSYVMNSEVCMTGGLPMGKSLRQPSVPWADAIVFWEADEGNPAGFNNFSNTGIEGISRRHGGFGLVGTLSGGAEGLPTKHFLELASRIETVGKANRLSWFGN